MDASSLGGGAAAAAGLTGLAAGALAGYAGRRRGGGGGRQVVASATAAVPGPGATPGTPALADLVAVLRSAAVLLDGRDDVQLVNTLARDAGLVRGDRLVVPELRRLARAARRDGRTRETETEVRGSRVAREPTAVRARACPVGTDGHVVLLVEDLSEARRVEAVRRDFVANVSHELKTPVGALSLLAEALVDASDDPEAVRRFAGRVQHESGRLGRLVQELLDLSRLQGAEPLPAPEQVPLDRVVLEALDRTRLAAEAARIALVAGPPTGALVLGDEAQLVTAVSNLVENAVTYSPPDTRVAVAVRVVPPTETEGETVEVSVSDQGIGIAETDLERVFERFYRADPARSRATGGTGLGLSIVKHIATNHGGTVSVWSVEGSGSTFTLRLPSAGTRVPALPPEVPA